MLFKVSIFVIWGLAYVNTDDDKKIETLFKVKLKPSLRTVLEAHIWCYENPDDCTQEIKSKLKKYTELLYTPDGLTSLCYTSNLNIGSNIKLSIDTKDLENGITDTIQKMIWCVKDTDNQCSLCSIQEIMWCLSNLDINFPLDRSNNFAFEFSILEAERSSTEMNTDNLTFIVNELLKNTSVTTEEKNEYESRLIHKREKLRVLTKAVKQLVDNYIQKTVSLRLGQSTKKIKEKQCIKPF